MDDNRLADYRLGHAIGKAMVGCLGMVCVGTQLGTALSMTAHCSVPRPKEKTVFLCYALCVYGKESLCTK